MKNRLVLICFCLSILTFSYAQQTNVSGFINANTTWDLAGSPYIVTGNALVSHGYTLTINPGVIVKFDPAKALQIDGELVAIGTPQNRITFTSNQAIPQAGDWAKLHFADTCVNAVFDSFGNYVSGCIMKYCDVLYGGDIGYGEVHIESSSPYISHCNILNSFSNGIHSVSSNYILDSSAIKNCIGYGLFYYNDNLILCNAKIIGDTIENNTNGGIKFDVGGQNFKNVLISDNYFISNAGTGTIHGGYVTHSTIKNNYFINNTGHDGVIFLYNISYDTIRCNKFINNHSYSGSCIFSYYSVSKAEISHNIFVGNTGTYSVIRIQHNTIDTISFHNNYIANNSSNYYNCYFISLMNYLAPISIDHNVFVDNTGPSVLCVAGSGSTNSINIKHNSFSNPGVQYELDNSIPYGSSNIYADSNYWGGTSTAHIDSVIQDYFDDANLSVVYYLPVLNTPIAVDTTCPPGIITDMYFEKIKSNSFIFPNPVADNFIVEKPDLQTDFIISIYNIQGQLILTQPLIELKTEINISSLAGGIYIIKLNSNEKSFIEKIVKE